MPTRTILALPKTERTFYYCKICNMLVLCEIYLQCKHVHFENVFVRIVVDFYTGSPGLSPVATPDTLSESGSIKSARSRRYVNAPKPPPS